MPAQAQTDAATVPLRTAIIGAVSILLGICTVLFFAFFRRQIIWAVTEQADWGHTLVIPLIAGYFVYLDREKILARPFTTTWIGLVPIVLGVGLYFFTAVGPLAVRHHNLQGFGAWLTLSGIVLLFCGFRAMRWLWFPLVYILVFGQTISNRVMTLVTYPLQDLTARGAHVTLMLLGAEVERSGNTLTMFENGTPIPLNVAEACSGMRMLMAFLALGVAMAYTGLKRFWQRALLVILAVPTAILVNIIRVDTLAYLSRVNRDFTAGDFHTFIGLVWLVPAFFLYLGLLWIIRTLVIEDDSLEKR